MYILPQVLTKRQLLLAC